VYERVPLTGEPDQKRGRKRAQVHAQTAMKALDADEPVLFAALIEHGYGLWGVVLGDSLFLLTDRAFVITREPGVPIASLSRVERHEYWEIQSVDLEVAQWFGNPSRLRVVFRDGGSNTLLLSPPGKSEEALALIRPHTAAA
jgi:hypothetical protein